MYWGITNLYAADKNRESVPALSHYVVDGKDTLWFLVPIDYTVMGSGKTIEPNIIKAPSVQAFYDSLRAKAYQNFFTRVLHDWIISGPPPTYNDNLNRRAYFRAFEGKTIGSIYFVHLDPFGPDFAYPDRKASTWVGRAANNIHVNTRNSFLYKSLLFKSGDKASSFKFAENERLLREYPFIRDVRIIPVPRANDPNIVDLTIMTKDVFSFGIEFDNVSAKSMEAKVYNKNAFGIGHELSASLLMNSDKTPATGYEVLYNINNIGGSFTDLSIGIGNNYNREGLGMQLKKDFKTPYTKWAGGVASYFLRNTYRISDDDPILSKNPMNFGFQEYWIGRSFPLCKNKGEETPHLILSSLFQFKHFNKRPEDTDQMAYYYSNSLAFFEGISYSKWKHKQANLIYGFGRTEDIPTGMLVEGVAGIDRNEFMKRGYGHIALSGGSFLSPRMNYLYTSVSFGGFFNKCHFQQGMFDFSAEYFSRLFYLDRFKARQFFSLYYTAGIHRFDPEGLFVKDDRGIRNFSSLDAIGSQRITFKSETVIFHEKDILNFRFASFYFSDFSLLGNSGAPLNDQKLYAGIGTGIRIRNESLVFRTIELAVEYFPSHPTGMSGFGFSIKGELRPVFKNFAGRKPIPLIFK
ncbi:MAG: hypothetical protein Q8862_08620 [Bacteroidota bacterium]|nr:hypothetical protein [Bacteroidota bacterium]